MHSQATNWNRNCLDPLPTRSIVADTTGLEAKVAAALQSPRLVKRGDDKAGLDVRILSTSKTDLDAADIEKKMNRDLLSRLSAFTVNVPPLRERKEDIPVLLGHCMRRLARHYGLPPRNLSTHALQG